MAENSRTTTARANDDHEMIDALIEDADTGISGGGGAINLRGDIGTQNDLVRAIDDPDAMTRPMKGDDIAHDQAYSKARQADTAGSN